MSETEKRKIRVFIASPGDLVEERKAFRDAITVLNIGFGDGANVEFVPLGWEDTLASTGRRSQGVINQDIDSCDVFILVMHRRWGQDAPDAAPYSSYTEEEFHRALERWKSSGSPEIFVFFKRVDAASEADPGPQLSKVIKFRQHLEETRQVLYRYFDSPESFLDEVDTHLRAYAKGELPKAEDRDDTVVLPIAALQEVEKAKQEVLQKTEEAKRANDAAEEARLKIEEAQLEMAEVAAQLSKEGKIEFARAKFTKLVTESTNLRILSLGFQFFYRTGDLLSAFNVLEKWLSLSGANIQSEETADALCNLGLLHNTKGEIEKSEENYRQSLYIYERIGNEEGMAAIYQNLGLLYRDKGEIEQAEELYRKSLAIHENIGNEEGLASVYVNLGNVCYYRGEFEEAEQLLKKSLYIYERMGDKEGLAIVYGNLGNIYKAKGDLDRGEEMYLKALSIDNAYGRKESMAIGYGNLGNVYRTRGDLDRAKEMYLKSLSLEEVLDHKEGIAHVCCNLGRLCHFQGDYVQAKTMYEKSTVLYREIGSPKAKGVEDLLKKLRNGNSPSESDAEA